MNIAPRLGEHAAILGMTGSGKTVLARQIISLYPFSIVHDSKDKIRWAGYKRVSRLSDLKRAAEPHLIYAPCPEELEDSDVIEEFFRFCYHRGNTCVYIDEVYAVTTARTMPRFYRAILTRGRELNVIAINASQRPKEIPQFILSESTNIYCFYLQMPQDRDRMTNILPLTDEMIRALPPRQFFYGRSDARGILGPLTLKIVQNV